MAMEPMTLFSRIADPAGVARLLRERVPTAKIAGPDESWSEAVVSLGAGTITFTHDPNYYAEPNWSVQMNGMRGYFSRFPETDRKAQALLLPNWIAGFSGVAGFGTLFFARVGHEERMMLETFGEEYRAYMVRVPALIPRLGSRGDQARA